MTCIHSPLAMWGFKGQLERHTHMLASARGLDSVQLKNALSIDGSSVITSIFPSWVTPLLLIVALRKTNVQPTAFFATAAHRTCQHGLSNGYGYATYQPNEKNPSAHPSFVTDSFYSCSNRSPT